MSKHARDKRTRKPPQPPPPSRTELLRRRARRWGLPAAGALAVAIVVALTLAQTRSSTAPAATRVSNGPAPAFSQQDVLSGKPITSASLRGRNVLLFFSEGVMCQACFEQIQSLQQRASELKSRGLTLVNITTDPPDVLRQAVQQYSIKTPMISDQTGQMSTAYGAIG
jgi:cytochrome oxidase Cu insertion factor (SCO1/SenC/PrrC family)